MIHTTIGIYLNGENKVNGVTSEHLASHIYYNITLRPGRAFFVDGYCLNNGYFSHEAILKIAEQMKLKNIKMDRDTAPYV